MKTRVIHTKIWKDDFIGEINAVEKLVFIYLLTNPQINICGTYELSDREIAFDLGISREELGKAKETLQMAGKFAFTDSWIRVLNIDKYQNYSGEKNDSAKDKELALIPYDVNKILYRYPIDGVSALVDSPSNKKSEIRNQKSEIRNKEQALDDSKEMPLSADSKIDWDFWESTMTEITRNKIFQRNALIRLSKAHGREKLHKMIKLAAIAHVEKYTPMSAKPSSPKDLETKWDALALWGKSKFVQSNQSNTIVI